MNVQINKTKTATIALVLTLTIAATLIVLPVAHAQEEHNSFPICVPVPNPIGKGQDVLIITGITMMTAWPQVGWEGLWVTIERPDGITDTIDDITTDTTGMTGVMYTPPIAGNYTLQTHFPEQPVTGFAFGRTYPVGDIMKASVSEKVKLVVTEEPREYHPGHLSAQEYWTRPIDSQLREWAPIAGNWFNVPSYNRWAPYNDAPETGHILWQKPLEDGGLVGADLDAMGYEHGDAYSGKNANPVILNGILYYNEYGTGFYGDTCEHKVSAVDLHTGEKLWSRALDHTVSTGERLAFGQIMYWETMDMYGAFAYLWTQARGTWNAYDPLTGRWEYSMTNVPSGNMVRGPRGEILIYTLNLANGWMTLWNSTNIPDLFGSTDWTYESPFGFVYAAWYPWGKTVNATGPATDPTDPRMALGRNGYMWNVSIPTDLEGSVQLMLEDRIIGGNTGNILVGPQPNPVFWGISLEPGDEGDELFNEAWTLPAEGVHVDIPDSGPVSPEDGVFIVGAKELRRYYGLSLDTGKQLWSTTYSPPHLESFSILYANPWGQSFCAYGNLYTAGMGGEVNAYDCTDGKHLWTYKITDQYTETLWGQWPAPIHFISDGKIYLFHQEHSGNTPLPRGAPAVCLNATDGTEIWRMNGLRLGTRWGGQPIIGDSIIAALSSYDNTIVAIGRGPSAIEVSTSPTVICNGESVLIQGMVTDVSPGTEEYGLRARFPHGVPAVADEYMSDWMLYVYKQFEAPMDVKGVDVLVQAMDSNGTITELGWVKCDGFGCFSLMWTPPDEDLYTIMTIFMGSKAYWPSYTQTGLGVSAVPEEPAEPAYLTMDLVIIVAVVVAICLVIYDIISVRKLRK